MSNIELSEVKSEKDNVWVEPADGVAASGGDNLSREVGTVLRTHLSATEVENATNTKPSCTGPRRETVSLSAFLLGVTSPVEALKTKTGNIGESDN